MFFFFASIVLLALFGFFYSIGLWYLALIPVLFFVLVFAASPSFRFSSDISRQILRYPLLIAWSLILIALSWLFWALWVPLPIVFCSALVLNFVLWIGSIMFNYDDWKQIFPFGYWLTFGVFLVVWLFYCSFVQYFSFLFILVSLHLWILAFALFILRMRYEQLIALSYHFLVTVCAWIFLYILISVPNFVGALVLAWWALFALYSGLWWFYQQRPVEKKQLSVRRILAWERITTKRVFSSLFLAETSMFLHHMPKVFVSCLEFLNIWLVVALLWFFAWHRSQVSDITQLLYWWVIALFVANTIILKKITTTNVLQNLFLFLIVHFAVYVSFFSYFGSAIGPVVFWTILWNVFTSVFLFYADRFSHGILTRLDYRYWLAAWWLSFVFNLVLLLQAPLSWELIFFFTLLYLGAEGVLLFYGSKYIAAMPSSKEEDK